MRREVFVGLVAALVANGTADRRALAKNTGSDESGKKPASSLWVPSFRSDVLPVLVQNCAHSPGCHGAHGTASVKLDLRETVAYAQLVDVPAVIRKGSLRVARGKPGESFLVDKLVGQLGPGEGKPMPLDDQTGMPLSPSPISASYIEHVLKPWIMANAPDN